VIENVDPVFVDLASALEAHIAYFGRKLECDENLFGSAVNAAANAWLYEGQTDLFELAAIYACRISQAHSFADGNKRTALLVAIGFLEANGIDSSHYSRSDLVEWLVDVAQKRINQRQFARRLRCASGLSTIAK
jgi:death-on-curing protein